ncbi:MAG: AMP-binding protein [Proteobacteria bacterium]|nr:AMP-binding protein [Pseudomonadota bacterium]
MLELISQLVDELHTRKGRTELSLDSLIERDLGIDSLGMVELLHRVEDRFSVVLPEQVLSSSETPRDLLRAVLAAGSGAAKTEALPRPYILPETEGVPHHTKTLLDVLEWHVNAHPDRQHIRFYGGPVDSLTYGDLKKKGEAVAAGLVSRGLLPGQSVAIMLPTGPDYFYSFIGALLAGAVPVPIYPPARPSQIEEHLRRHSAILNNSLAAILITVAEAQPIARLLKGRVETLKSVVTAGELIVEGGEFRPHPGKPEDVALFQYTSGTTGNPKGVVLTHSNLLANIRAMGENVEATSRDVFVSWLPLYHDMGLIGAWLGSLYYGMLLVLMSPLSFLARPERWLQAIHQYRGTISGGPNFGYELCLRKQSTESLDLSSWRIAFNGAEPVSPETVTRFQDCFAKSGFKAQAYSPVYGLAESSVGLAFPPLGRGPLIDRIQREAFIRDRRALPADETYSHPLRFVASGRPLSGHEIRVVDANGREVGERVEGQLQFKGPSATSGYFRNPEATARLFHGEWLDSGDLAYMAGGDIYLTGRSKDIIIRAGRNIYPDELEEAVGNIPGIRKGCVVAFGSIDPVTGTERLVLLAETRETEAVILERFHKEINAITIDLLGTPPEDVVLVPPRTVLKTSSGKIRRAASRELYEKGKTGLGQRALWWQFARLWLLGLAPQLKRLWRRSVEFLYASWAWMVFYTMAITTWSLVAIIPGLVRRRSIVKEIARSAVKLTGISLSVSGLDRLPGNKTCVLVSNHASYLDGIMLAAALPPTFCYVAKRDLKGSFIPLLFLRRIDARFVERFDMESGLDDARYISDSVRKGDSLAFFPEGTFGRMPGLRPFYMGAFVSSAEAGVPLVPVVIRGTRSILRALSWFPRRGAVKVTICEPIMPKGSDWAAAIELRDAARSEMLRHCGEPDLSN